MTFSNNSTEAAEDVWNKRRQCEVFLLWFNGQRYCLVAPFWLSFPFSLFPQPPPFPQLPVSSFHVCPVPHLIQRPEQHLLLDPRVFGFVFAMQLQPPTVLHASRLCA